MTRVPTTNTRAHDRAGMSKSYEGYTGTGHRPFAQCLVLGVTVYRPCFSRPTRPFATNELQVRARVSALSRHHTMRLFRNDFNRFERSEKHNYTLKVPSVSYCVSFGVSIKIH